MSRGQLRVKWRTRGREMETWKVTDVEDVWEVGRRSWVKEGRHS